MEGLGNFPPSFLIEIRQERKRMRRPEIKLKNIIRRILSRKNGLYSKEDSFALEGNRQESPKDEVDEFLLMALESKSKYKNESNLKEEEDESVVDLEGELINALDELKMT